MQNTGRAAWFHNTPVVRFKVPGSDAQHSNANVVKGERTTCAQCELDKHVPLHPGNRHRHLSHSSRTYKNPFKNIMMLRFSATSWGFGVHVRRFGVPKLATAQSRRFGRHLGGCWSTGAPGRCPGCGVERDGKTMRTASFRPAF